MTKEFLTARVLQAGRGSGGGTGSAPSPAGFATDPVGTLARGLHVLSCVAALGGHVGAAEIARRAHLPKGTTHRLASKLADLGYLERDHQGRFCPGLRILDLGYLFLAASNLREQAMSEMRTLRERFECSIGLCVRDRTEVVYLERLASSGLEPMIPLEVGARLPVHCTAVGKAILAHLPTRMLEPIIASIRFEQLTSRTISSSAALLADLRATRKRQFSISDQELFVGFRSVAAPIFDDNGLPIGGLTLGVFADAMNLRDLRDIVGPSVLESSRAVSSRLALSRFPAS
jgi:DNA-binding IclR family transcriptional regulator